MDGAVTARGALVHNLGRDDPVEGQHILLGEGSFGGVFLDEAERGKIVDNLASCPGLNCWEFTAFLDGPNLFEREGIAFDGGRRVGIAGSGILLQSRNPLDLNGS